MALTQAQAAARAGPGCTGAVSDPGPGATVAAARPSRTRLSHSRGSPDVGRSTPAGRALRLPGGDGVCAEAARAHFRHLPGGRAGQRGLARHLWDRSAALVPAWLGMSDIVADLGMGRSACTAAGRSSWSDLVDSFLRQRIALAEEAADGVASSNYPPFTPICKRARKGCLGGSSQTSHDPGFELRCYRTRLDCIAYVPSRAPANDPQLRGLQKGVRSSLVPGRKPCSGTPRTNRRRVRCRCGQPRTRRTSTRC